MARDNMLPFAPPFIGPEEVEEVVESLRSGWITTGPRTSRFEQEFAAACDAEAALAVSSCTAGLQIALAVLGVRPGESVITSPMTFVSGVHVIEHLGGRPLLVDVEPDTLNISPDRVAEALARETKAPRAIVATHLYGHPCEMDELLNLGTALVEDAAHALPAGYKGSPIGSHHRQADVPVLTCFSFYATKNLTTAEGGMVTGTQEVIDEARRWSLHGMDHDAWNRYGEDGRWRYDVTRPGFKANLPDVLSALGIHQLARLSRSHARRAAIAERYTYAFSQSDVLQPPTCAPHVEHAWHIYSLRLHLDRLGITREQFIEELSKRKIATSVHFIPVHLFTYYRERYGFQPDDFPVATQEFRRLVSLPIYPQMSEQDVDDVIEAVVDVVTKYRR